MRRAGYIAHLALLALGATCVHAAEVAPFVENGMLGARVRGLQFPQTLPKDLTSGLTSRILTRVMLLAPGRPTSRHLVEITVKYDLWDETFRFTLAVDERVLVSETHATLDAVLARLHDAKLPALFPETALERGVAYTLRAEVLLNPIDRERMEKIRKWVAENSTYAPGQSGVPDSRTSSTSNELFNRIFEEYAAGAAATATWSETAVSSPFRAESVPHERP